MPKKPVSPDDFSDEEKEQIARYGQAMSYPATGFDEEVEKELEKLYPQEFAHQKMHAAQTGGASLDQPVLGPTAIAKAQIKGSQAAQQQHAAEQAQEAQQAQQAQVSPNVPPAPIGPEGVSEPYPAQNESEETSE
jgi:hypothetical protein